MPCRVITSRVCSLKVITQGIEMKSLNKVQRVRSTVEAGSATPCLEKNLQSPERQREEIIIETLHWSVFSLNGAGSSLWRS
jgi:hypothetical protein